jgi:hypothetical protein
MSDTQIRHTLPGFPRERWRRPWRDRYHLEIRKATAKPPETVHHPQCQGLENSGFDAGYNRHGCDWLVTSLVALHARDPFQEKSLGTPSGFVRRKEASRQTTAQAGLSISGLAISYAEAILGRMMVPGLAIRFLGVQLQLRATVPGSEPKVLNL